MRKDYSARFGIFLVALSGWGAGLAHAEADMDLNPISFGNYTTLGVLNGTPEDIEIYKGGGGDANNEPFSRTAVWLTQEATINEALLISVGVGGLFWYSRPEFDAAPWTRLIKFGPGVHVAAGTYRFGDVESPWLQLKAGYFPHKYNPDSRNLGEYLFRSGTYPGTVFTGGWSVVNSAGYAANGLLGAFSFLDDRLKVDVGLFMERGFEPNFDLSPSIVASYDVGGILDLGAGIVFSHLIPFQPSKTNPKFMVNAYSDHPSVRDTVTGKALPLPDGPGLNDDPAQGPTLSAVLPVGHPLVGKPLPAAGETMVWRSSDGPFPAELESMGIRNGDTIVFTQDHPTLGDPTLKLDKAEQRAKRYFADTVYGPNANGLPEEDIDGYYTFQGQKVMARAAFRPQNLLQSDLLGPDDLTIYGEVALLGIKDYPFFYEKKSERMPVMFGINLPAFKLLDALTLEFEYHKTRFRNNTINVFKNSLPTWDLRQGRTSLPPRVWLERERGTADPADVADFEEALGDSDWWWSLYAKKTIMPGFRMHLQVAKDHYRVINYNTAPSYEPIFHKKGLSDWYWALKLEFGA